MNMQIYRATHIETGEIIEGGARDLAKKLGVVTKSIYNAVALQQKIKYVWFISTNAKQSKASGNTNRITPQLLDEWDAVAESFKKASKKGCKKEKSRIKLRTMYNVGVY